MHPTIVAATLALLLAHSAPAADTTFAQLPEDGAWSKFYVTVSGPNNLNLTIEMTLSSVGKTQATGKDCRWIEMASVNAGSGERYNVFKMLIPEDALKEGPFGPSDAIRAWAAEMDNSAQAVSADGLAPVSFLFPDTLDDAQRLDEQETVDWQRGQLECAVLTGTSDSRLGTQDIEIEHRYLLAAEIPFGLGGFRSVIQFDNGTTINVDARLLDTGAGAVSALPNSQ